MYLSSRFPLLLCAIIITFGTNTEIGCCGIPLDYKTTLISGLSNKNLPHCVENVLYKDSIFFKEGSSSYNRNLFSESHNRHCRLLRYTVKDAVACFDALYQEQILFNFQEIPKNASKSKKLFFVFMGDSRIRQQFFNFLQLIPDYDRNTNPIQIPKFENAFTHGDVDVESSILKLRVSFKWRPIINDTVMENIQEWARADQSQRPHWIFLGIETHHMLQTNGANYLIFEKRIKKLGQMLGQLANVSQIIWLNQYPIVDFFGPTYAHNTDIYSEKVHNYNEGVRRVLKKQFGVRIWDSSNPLAEEYVRGCTVYPERQISPTVFRERNEPFNPISSKPYISCLDFIHTGYVALSLATQLLYNDMCNIKI